MRAKQILLNPFILFAALILLSMGAIWLEVFVYNSRPFYTSEEEIDSAVESFGVFAPYLI